MTQQRKKMVIAVMLAVICSFLLFGVTYVFFSIQPEHTLGLSSSVGLGSALWATLWIGLSILIAITVVAIMISVNRVRTKKHYLQVGLSCIPKNNV
jgi:ABC-type Fe3+ transport system permease subunit